MEKNTILAIVLSMAFLIIWYSFTAKNQQRYPVENPAVSEQTIAEEQIQEDQAVDEAIGSFAQEEKEVTVQTPQAKIVFDTRSAGIKKWEIKDITGWVDLVLPNDETRMPLETFPAVVFTPSVDFLEITDAPQDISFTARTKTGLIVTKTYRISPDSYLVDLTIRLKNTGSDTMKISDWSIGWGPGLNTVKRELKENKRHMRAIGLGKEKLVKLRSQATHREMFKWAGIDNRYFLAAVIPINFSDFTYLTASTQKKVPPWFSWHASTELMPQEVKQYSFKVYVGPKGYAHLTDLGFDLEESVNFGLFSFLGKFVLKALQYFYRVTGNYGWAIVLLTMCLQVFFFPLSLKSFKASLAMKKLQPQIKQIQTKYKGDSKRLNVELMNLYKTSGTNPFGGCLPMLLQIPVFWALFTTLRNAFELRGAPFILWIKDLSVYDPFYVLPILMGIGMLVQQKFTAVSADPNQARMMMLMPIVFTFMFLKFPSGLVLYWFTNSLLTMAGQFMVMQKNKRKNRGISA